MANTLAPGSVLNGRYRIDGVAGSGGMGAVYRAFDTGLGGRSVAVKEMSEEGLSPQEITEATSAFQQEAHLLARLQHPNLPRIHDHFTDNGRWYLVMDFIEGETLDDYLRRYGTPGLPVDTVLHIAAQICAVLQYLHGHVPPIVFRDLKPSNVMLAAGFHVYLLDFGIARIFKPGASHDTHAIGTEGYAAPEQFGKSQTTVRSDIFSFGATLHQLLTGVDPAVKPFTFSAIHPLNPLVPARLVALITWMVQMDEQKRPPNMGVVHQELTWIAAQASPTQTFTSQQSQSAARGYSASYAAPNSISAQYAGMSVAVRSRRRTATIVGILAAVLVTLCIVALACSSVNGSLENLVQSASTAAAQSAETTNAESTQSIIQSTVSAAQSTVSSDESTLGSDESTLSSDVASLAQESGFDSDLASYAQDWSQMQADYQQEQQDYQQGCSNAGTVQTDAGSVATDLGSIQTDDGSFASSIDSFNPALQQVQSDIGTVQTGLQTLENDAAVVDISVATSESGAQAALQSAEQQVTTSDQVLQSAQAQVKQYDQETAEMNTNAQNLANGMHC